jgi:GNAT superfamily N-acetyltransferase
MTLTFRNATNDDLPAVVALIADDDISKAREHAVPEAYVEAFAEMSKTPDNRMVLAEQDGVLAGCLQLVFISGLSRGGAKRAIIESVRVASELRGRGIGSALVHHAIDEGRKAGCKLVQLTSDIRRVRAHLFYRRLGFAQSHLGFKLEL